MPNPERFLQTLSAEQAAELGSRGSERRFPPGTAIFHERQVPDFVAAVLAGRVKLSATTDEGRDVVLAVRGPGELLGELSALDQLPRSATATAIDEVTALIVPASSFVAFLEERSAVSISIVRMLSRRLRDADRKRVEFAALDSVGRVASRLNELCERFGEAEDEGVRIDLPFTQEELAAWAACSREAMDKALRTLRELGWIKTGRRTITVLDPEALRTRGR